MPRVFVPDSRDKSTGGHWKEVGADNAPGATGTEGQVSGLGSREKSSGGELKQLPNESPADYGARLRKWRESGGGATPKPSPSPSPQKKAVGQMLTATTATEDDH